MGSRQNAHLGAHSVHTGYSLPKAQIYLANIIIPVLYSIFYKANIICAKLYYSEPTGQIDLTYQN